MKSGPGSHRRLAGHLFEFIVQRLRAALVVLYPEASSKRLLLGLGAGDLMSHAWVSSVAGKTQAMHKTRTHG